jgi:Domain of unknown function (DUF4397)
MKSLVKTFTNIVAAVLPIAMFSGCALEVVPPPVGGQLLIAHYVPAPATPMPAVFAPNLQIAFDGEVQLANTTVAAGTTTGYFFLNPGSRTIALSARDANTTVNPAITAGQSFGSFTFDSKASEFSTAFLIPNDGKIEPVVIADAIPAAKDSVSHVRFVHLIPGAGGVDVAIRRTTYTYQTIDTLGTRRVMARPTVTITRPAQFTNITFKKAADFVEIAAVSLCSPTNRGCNPTLRATSYSYDVYLTGTTTRVGTAIAGSAANLPENRRVITFALTGTAAAPRTNVILNRR